MAENGIRMTPYQTLACESMRAATTIPEFHFAPACPLRILAIDLEVHPFTLRGHLELFVTCDVLEIGSDERLCDVPVPQPRRLSGRVGLGLQIQLVIRTDESR